MSLPVLILHGGCGRLESNAIPYASYDEKLRLIAECGWEHLAGHSAEETVLHVMRMLEDEEIFNAGTGSKLQRDGRARMSAAIMDGRRNRFSGVINVERIRHPIDLAHRLQGEDHRVLAGSCAVDYARAQGFADFDPVTEFRLREHEERRAGKTGTCGAVVVDRKGRIWAATSTGGIGFEVPGRVGDSATVAGTYANLHCGVSCTGIGEEIVNEAVAATLVTRVTDGMSLAEAVRRTIEGGKARQCTIGLIAASRYGSVSVGQTPAVTVLYAHRSSAGLRTFLDEPQPASDFRKTN